MALRGEGFGAIAEGLAARGEGVFLGPAEGRAPRGGGVFRGPAEGGKGPLALFPQGEGSLAARGRSVVQ